MRPPELCGGALGGMGHHEADVVLLPERARTRRVEADADEAERPQDGFKLRRLIDGDLDEVDATQRQRIRRRRVVRGR